MWRAIGIALVLMGCADIPRQFNRPPKRDLMCYNKYGGMEGYCNVETDR